MKIRDRTERSPKERSGPLSECRVRGCPKIPSERKPYCLEHLDQLPYTQQLQANLQTQETELSRAPRNAKIIDLRGVIAQEILSELGKKPLTQAKLGQTMQINKPAIAAYVRRLKNAGIIKEVTTVGKKGRITVHLMPVSS